MLPYSQRSDTILISEKEKLELEKIKNVIFDLIHSKTYTNPRISVDVQIFITDRLGDIVIKDRYLALL